MYYVLGQNTAKNNALLQRLMRENIGVSQEMLGIRRRPLPVRNLLSVSLTGAVKLTWLGPQNLAGITGYNVYEGSETGPVQTVAAPQFPSSGPSGSNIANSGSPVVQLIVSGLTSGVKIAFYVSSFTALLESIKSQIIAAAS
jgi:hypothetical protein